MIDKLTYWDTVLFRAINNTRSSWADMLLAFCGSHFFVTVIVVLAGIYVMYKNNWKHFYIYILAIGLCFLIADRISVLCFKDTVCRLRPSHALQDVFNIKFSHFHYIYGNKGGMYGFVSSHAANVFSIITALSLIVLSKNKKHKQQDLIFMSLMVLWGLIICYSRIYCGYHYPLDVLCGSLLGIVLGFIVFVLYKLVLKKFYHE